MTFGQHAFFQWHLTNRHLSHDISPTGICPMTFGQQAFVQWNFDKKHLANNIWPTGICPMTFGQETFVQWYLDNMHLANLLRANWHLDYVMFCWQSNDHVIWSTVIASVFPNGCSIKTSRTYNVCVPGKLVRLSELVWLWLTIEKALAYNKIY
jgi:hypothetical protein